MNDLTIQLVIIAALIILLAVLMLKPQIKELLGKDENEKKFVCPRCGKKSQVGTYSRETNEFVCVDCADKEKEETIDGN